MKANSLKQQRACRRTQLATLYKHFVDSKTSVSRNRAAWKLFRLILHAKVPFASLKLSAMSRRNYTWYESAVIELFRLGYDFTSHTRWPPIGSENANDLLYCVGSDEKLAPVLFAGVVWAAKKRLVAWDFQIHCAQQEGYSKQLDLILRKAGLLHIKRALIDANGKVKEPAWMEIPDAEKQAINLRLTAKIAAMTEEERSARCDELIKLSKASESYETMSEFLKLMIGG
jgi:hypothetical protein